MCMFMSVCIFVSVLCSCLCVCVFVLLVVSMCMCVCVRAGTLVCVQMHKYDLSLHLLHPPPPTSGILQVRKGSVHSQLGTIAMPMAGLSSLI